MRKFIAILTAAALVFSTLAYAQTQLSRKNPDGTTLGQSTTDKISFYGVTPIVQPSGSSQTTLTDNSGGTASPTAGVSANAQKEVIVVPIGMLSFVANSQIWKVALPYAFTVTDAKFRVGVAATDTSKAATLTVQVQDVSVTGGVIALTSANVSPTGAAVSATAITAGNTGTAGQTVGVVASSVTTFTAGAIGYLELTVTNTDKANQSATLAAMGNGARSALVNLGLIKGSS